ncbi:restriction endonuclease subunit S [Anaerococcus lactolyticus]|uniref:restriction endonuclease subunit S n=1 Tax=Anaerococcus lactolyticus TaxID=33032 RepID=UPI0009D79051|nr:restriction endonuclease subunit S [Anaerococcus lactolyticus]
MRDSLITKNYNNISYNLNIDLWKEFKVKDIFNVKYGVNLELNKCIEVNNGINFVSRTAENNGVSAIVELIDDVIPQKPGLLTVAGGGSVLSTFLQNKEFYSGRDLYTLESKEELSDLVKLFLTTIIEKNKYKYNYGRQANKTLPDLILELPIKRNSDDNPIIDKNRTYSSDGYIPDWDFMEKYIKSLPFGDKISKTGG